MRGWFGGLLAIIMVAACYSPTVLPGAPCVLELDNCPRSQHCELVGAESICVETGSGAIDARDDASANDDASATDDAAMIDAPIDASIDAMPDAMTPDASLAKWTLVQHKGGQGVVNFGATGAGNLIVVAIETSAGAAISAVTDSAGSTYVRATGSRAVNMQENFAVEVWYTADAHAGATTITPTAGMVFSVVMWEVDGMKPNPLGNVAKLDNQAASTTPGGAPIATTTTGEFVVSVVIVAFLANNILPGDFTNDETTFGNGWAHLTSNTTPAGTYSAEWNATNGASCASSVAFRAN